MVHGSRTFGQRDNDVFYTNKAAFSPKATVDGNAIATRLDMYYQISMYSWATT